MTTDEFFVLPEVIAIAQAAAHLTDGYLGKAQMDHANLPTYQADNGYLATTERIAALAILVHHALKDYAGVQDWPGVYHYEVTEPMGSWFHANSTCTEDQFEIELRRRNAEWFAQGRPR